MLLKKYSLDFLKGKYKEEKDMKIKERFQIILLLREGNSQRDVSATLYISLGKVSFWKGRLEKGGVEMLKDKKGRGLKSKLQENELNVIDSKVQKGITMKNGYKRGFKTKDVKELIKKDFGIIYTLRHCRRLLRKLKFNLKVPRPRHKKRNQESVEEFKKNFKKNLEVWTKT